MRLVRGIKMGRKDCKLQLELYSIISKISASFASMLRQEQDNVINESLSLVGNFVNVDRVYIFRYDLARNTCTNTYEWVSQGTKSAIKDLQNIPLDNVPDWIGFHKERKVLYIENVKHLPNNNALKEVLTSLDIKSLITIPMFYENQLYGFIGFDSVNKVRRYSKFETTTLYEFSNVLLSAIKRVEIENSIQKEKMKVEYLLDTSNIGAWEWNVRTNKVIYNEKWAEVVGYKLSELSPLTFDTWLRLTNKDDGIIAQNEISRTL